MPDLRIEKAHSFDFATARTQAQQWLQEAQAEFGLQAPYHQGDNVDTATIKKSGVDAKAVLDANKIVFEADFNFLAKPFKGVIQSGIQQGLDKFFA